MTRDASPGSSSDDVGYRTLDAEIVERKGLLEGTGDSNVSGADG